MTLPILGLVLIILLALLLFALYKNRQLNQRISTLEKSSQDWSYQLDASNSVKQTEEVENFEQQHSQKIEKLTEDFHLSLQNTLKQISEQLNQNANQTQRASTDFLNTQQKQIMEWQEAMETETKNRISEFLENFESNLSQFFTKAEQTSLDSINLELKSARSLIDSYKSQQLGIVEENIVAVLERTLAIVLKEKLSLKDQLDLVYEALEKAKIEKFLL